MTPKNNSPDLMKLCGLVPPQDLHKLEFETEPRWPAIITVLASGALYAGLPPSLTVGPRWLMPGIIFALLVAAIVTNHTKRHDLNHNIGVAEAFVMTVFLAWSVGLLVASLPRHEETPQRLLISAIALWITNVLVFATWYWRIDAGGPHMRDMRRGAQIGHRYGAFLFPQMTLDDDVKAETGQKNWTPQFMDYLFLAFNTSTALSPTDTSVLGRRAKLLMMVQSALSLTIIALLAARAVNIL